jgi:hypothetical protein
VNQDVTQDRNDQDGIEDDTNLRAHKVCCTHTLQECSMSMLIPCVLQAMAQRPKRQRPTKAHVVSIRIRRLGEATLEVRGDFRSVRDLKDWYLRERNERGATFSQCNPHVFTHLGRPMPDDLKLSCFNFGLQNTIFSTQGAPQAKWLFIRIKRLGEATLEVWGDFRSANAYTVRDLKHWYLYERNERKVDKYGATVLQCNPKYKCGATILQCNPHVFTHLGRPMPDDLKLSCFNFRLQNTILSTHDAPQAKGLRFMLGMPTEYHLLHASKILAIIVG